MRPKIVPNVLHSCLALCLALLPVFPAQAQATDSACAITSPANDSWITGPITITGTYTKAYQVVMAVDAGTIFAVHMDDPDGDDSGTWSYTWEPFGYSGKVELTVRCFADTDRYYRWGAPLFVNVGIPSQIPAQMVITSPKEGETARAVTPILVSASDARGISSVQVRVDWGPWQATSDTGSNYAYNWDTNGLGDKTHALEARAIDKDGNITKTATIYVKTGQGTREQPMVRQAERAMWLWEPAAYQLLENPGARIVLGRFMNDPGLSKQGIKTIYFYADRYDDAYALLENPEAYRSFIRWAHSHGVYVHALLGSSFYMAPMLTYARYHSKAVELIENVLNYNISSAPQEQFDGVNIDIEPHGLADWRVSPTVQLQYLGMLSELMQRKLASGQNLNVGPAIPRWFDTNNECLNIDWHGTVKNCAQHIQDITDYVSVMDYRDEAAGPSGIIVNGQGEIEYADQIGKQVMISVETDQISFSGDPAVITFQEEGRLFMEKMLDQVYKAFGNDPSFLGIVIHHYDSYRELPTAWGTRGTQWWTTGIWNTSGTHLLMPLLDKTAPSIPVELSALAWDWQNISLHWRRCSDNLLVDHYEIHRSLLGDFTPSAATLVQNTRFNFVKDWGLLPNTTYYYRVLAVDGSGNKSSASLAASATTPAGTGLKPMRIESISLVNSGGAGLATIKIVDAETGAAISGASVFGHWEEAAGQKFTGHTRADGTLLVKSDSPTAPWTLMFVPERILASGYYWDYSQDEIHTAILTHP